MIEVSTLADLYKRNLRIDWDIEGWLPSNTIGVVAGLSGAGKTVLTADLAISLAHGLPFLGKHPVEVRKRVLVLQQEDAIAHTFVKYKTMEESKLGKLTESTLTRTDDGFSFGGGIRSTDNIIFPEYTSFTMQSPETMQALEEIIIKNKIDIVIVDPFNTFADVKDHMVAAVKQMKQYLRPLRDNLGTTFLIVHHANKEAYNTDTGDERYMMHGSGLLVASFETYWGVHEVKEHRVGQFSRVVRLSRRQKSLGDAEPMLLTVTLNSDENIYNVEQMSDKKVESLEQLNPTDLGIEEFVQDADGISIPELAKLAGKSQSHLYKIIGRLQDEGRIIKRGKLFFAPRDRF